jgi:hypothetical protein
MDPTIARKLCLEVSTKLKNCKIKKSEFNTALKKDKKHTSINYVLLQDEFGTIELKDDKIYVYYNKNKSVYTLFDYDDIDNEFPQSYSLDTITRLQHIDNVVIELEQHYNLLQGQNSIFYYKIKDCTLDKCYYTPSRDEYMFSEVYKIGAERNAICAFIHSDNKIIICNCYVVAKGLNDKWNIFFDYDETFEQTRKFAFIKYFNKYSKVTVKNFYSIITETCNMFYGNLNCPILQCSISLTNCETNSVIRESLQNTDKANNIAQTLNIDK